MKEDVDYVADYDYDYEEEININEECIRRVRIFTTWSGH